MKCRAKTITGQPLTFEITPEEVVDRDGHPHLQQDAIGEGFFVRSVPYAYWGGTKYRLDRMKSALDRAGVDTATVEYHQWGVNRFGKPWEKWLPLFTPVVKQPWKVGWVDAGGKPGGIIYTEDEVTSLRSMLDAERRMNKELSERLAAKVLDKAFSDATKMPGRMIYVGAEGLVTEAMLEAGWAAMRASPLYGEPAKTLEMIWRAMEKARTK